MFEDINGISIGNLARSEVLKDGASAIYGSDAVAGVVNFILIGGPGEAPYEGAEVDFLYGNTTDTDARVIQTYIRGGVATDKVSVAAAASYYDALGLFSRDREISATADRRPLGGANTGSPTFPGRVSVGAGIPRPGGTPFPQAARGVRVINDPSGVSDPTDPARGFRLYGGGNSADPFNFRAYTPAIPARTTYSTYVTGRYKIFGDALQVYGDMLYTKRKQDNGLAPSPFAFNTVANGLGDAQNSPFNPFGNALTIVSYRTVQEAGLRRSFFDYDYYRWTVGLNGNFTFTGNGFISYLGYDTGMVYERGDYKRVDSGDMTRGGVRAGLRGDGPSGAFFNPFIGLSAPVSGQAPTYVGGVPTGMTAFYDNQAAINDALYVGNSFFYDREFLADAKVFGNLFPNMWQGGVGFNVGYEYRQGRTKNIPDVVQAQGDQLGFNAAANNSFKQEVNSFFTELQIPWVTSAMGVPFVRSLETSVAWRYESFDNTDRFTKRTSSFNNNGDFRITLRYQPIADVTLRASWGESFLSPTPTQLFDPVQQNFPQVFDPFPIQSLGPPVQRGQTLQPINGVQQGGNVALVPETTQTWTAGLVYTPKFVPGLTMTIDLYQIYTQNVILGSADFAQLALTQNGNFLAAADVPPGGPPAGGAPFANIIQRAAVFPYQVESIDAVSANAGKRLVNGMDITAAYQIPTTNWGTFTLSLGYNYFFTWKAEPVAGTGTHSFLGDYNNGTLPLAPGAVPYHKGFLRGEWEWRGFDFVATTNYISSFNDDSAFVVTVGGVPVEVVGGTDTDPQYNLYRRVSDYITLDLQLSYAFVKPAMEPVTGYTKDAKSGKNVAVAGVENNGTFWQRMLWGTTIRVGCNNVFDRTPPTVLGAFNDNYDTSLYNIRNRYYYVGINKKF